MPSRRAFSALVAGMVLLSSCASGEATLSVTTAAAEAALPDAEIPSRDTRLEAATWKQAASWAAREVADGRPVVINLFASWCGPCRAEAPLLRQAIEAHPDVAFLLVDHLDQRDKGEAFLVDEGLDHVPSVFDDLADIAGALQSRGMPSTAFFSAQGDLVLLVNGVLTEPVLAQALADLEATIEDR